MRPFEDGECLMDSHLDHDIADYYAAGRDIGRLEGVGALEAERTRRILLGRLSDRGAARVVDIGGGAGGHAFWLATQGHAVTLVDPVDVHVNEAMSRNAAATSRLTGIHRAAAAQLPLPSEAFDAGLMFGPLYHLTVRGDRLAAMREARRVLVPGGLLFASALPRHSWLIRSLLNGFVHDDYYWGRAANEVETGVHTNPERKPGHFTTAYLHRPEDLATEVKESGFTLLELLAVDGLLPMLPGFTEKWGEHGSRERLLDALELIESEPSLLGSSAHILIVARKDGLEDR